MRGGGNVVVLVVGRGRGRRGRAWGGGVWEVELGVLGGVWVARGVGVGGRRGRVRVGVEGEVLNGDVGGLC